MSQPRPPDEFLREHQAEIEAGPMSWKEACERHPLRVCAFSVNGASWGLTVSAFRRASIGSDDVTYVLRPVSTPKPSQAVPDDLPPLPTPEQLAKLRYPDGRRLKMPTMCEEPNGRPYISFSANDVYTSPPDRLFFGGRRWLAEPEDAVVVPWKLDKSHAGKVVEHKQGAGWGTIVGVREMAFVLTGWGRVYPADLLRDWTYKGGLCGDVEAQP